MWGKCTCNTALEEYHSVPKLHVKIRYSYTEKGTKVHVVGLRPWFCLKHLCHVEVTRLAFFIASMCFNKTNPFAGTPLNASTLIGYKRKIYQKLRCQ